MQDIINSYKDKIRIKKNKIPKSNKDTSKINTFHSANFNAPETDNEYIKKKRNRSLSDKKAYFKIYKNSEL